MLPAGTGPIRSSEAVDADASLKSLLESASDTDDANSAVPATTWEIDVAAPEVVTDAGAK